MIIWAWNGLGKSNESNGVWTVVHCMPWLRTLCEKEGLRIDLLEEIATKLAGKENQVRAMPGCPVSVDRMATVCLVIDQILRL